MIHLKMLRIVEWWPDNSEWPSLCRWGCLSHKAACCLDCPSLQRWPLQLFSLKLLAVKSYQAGGLTCCRRPWRSGRRHWGRSRRCSPSRGRTQSWGSWSGWPRTCTTLGQESPLKKAKCFAGCIKVCLCFIFESGTLTLSSYCIVGISKDRNIGYKNI